VTLDRELAFLHNVYSMAMACGKASENPVKQVRFARENNGRMRMLSSEEDQRLLTCCGPQLRLLVLTALYTRFRKSELLSLIWDDVDFQRHVITVQAAYSKNGASQGVPMQGHSVFLFVPSPWPGRGVG
jgi:integrase